jgi:hypothetical protein
VLVRTAPWLRFAVVAGITFVAAGAAIVKGAAAYQAPRSLCPGAESRLFGPNVCVFSPKMPLPAVQADLDAIATRQVPNQFGPQRYAILFEPGTYGSRADPLMFEVGYYTEVAGLGQSPQATVVNGVVDVFNQCFGAPDASGGGTDCVGTNNFWRSLYNLTINPMTSAGPHGWSPPPPDTYDYSVHNGTKSYNPGCNGANETWAASQAAPMRRVIINGFLSLDDTCGDKNYTSGGFIADSELRGGVRNGSQQQFLVRNSTIDKAWTNGVWDQVFLGDDGDAVPGQSFGPVSLENGGPEPYTTLARTPVSEEEPYLFVSPGGGYQVGLPKLERATSGPSWADGKDQGRALPLANFYIANPGSKEPAINSALAAGKDLVLTPGIYALGSPILVKRPGTVVLGLGFPTLVPTHGNVSMIVVPDQGARVSGLIFDAGRSPSAELLMVGSGRGPGSTFAAPDVVQDTYFRVGGAAQGSADISFLDAAAGSVLDNVWAWRADHGLGPGAAGWGSSQGATGLVVRADHVSAYGLFVEHYQKAEVVWSGQDGTDVFFQNEMPYDPPDQQAWMQDKATDGYPAFVVTSNVRTFHGYGMGSYCFFDVADIPGDAHPPVQAAMAFESPTAPGIRWRDLLAVSINGTGVIRDIINSIGPATIVGTRTAPATVPVNLATYP